MDIKSIVILIMVSTVCSVILTTMIVAIVNPKLVSENVVGSPDKIDLFFKKCCVCSICRHRNDYALLNVHRNQL